MKKIFVLLMSVVVVALTLTACGQTASKKLQDPQKIADQIKSSAKFTDQLSALDATAAEKRYGIDASSVSSCAVYVGTGATAEEIAVWKTTGDAAVKTVTQKIKAFVSAQEGSYADYRPSEVPKLKNAVIKQSGDIVVFCVSADDNKASQIVSGLV